MKIPKKVWDNSIQSLDDLKGKVYVQTRQGIKRIFLRRDWFDEWLNESELIRRTEEYKFTIVRRVTDGYLVCHSYAMHSSPDLADHHPMFKNYWMAYSYKLRLKRHGVKFDED